jgi:hypothetical protein
MRPAQYGLPECILDLCTFDNRHHPESLVVWWTLGAIKCLPNSMSMRSGPAGSAVLISSSGTFDAIITDPPRKLISHLKRPNRTQLQSV